MEETKMFNLFKPKKLYCVRFSWFEDDAIKQEIVKAKDIVDAWEQIKRKHGTTANFCHSITEIKAEEFGGANRIR